MKVRTIVIPVVLAALGATALYLEGGARLLGHRTGSETRKETAAPPAARALAVSVVRATTRDITETLLVTGSLVPREEVLVAPQVEGLRVEELKVDEGARVKKGDVLATLTHDTLDAQIAQNDASLARANAAIAQAQAQIAQAEARVKEASNAFDRAQPLSKSGYLSGATLDQRESAARVADAQLVAARDGLKVASADRGVIEAQRRELDWKRSRTQVRAPADGIVSRRTARIGAIATAIGEPMFRIVAAGEVELDAEVTDAALPRLAVGQPARIEVAGGAQVAGRVRLVPAEVDKATRLGHARIFIGDEPAIRIGSFAHARIEVGTAHAVTVPASALLFGDGGATTVQVVVGNRITTRRVETGLVADGIVAVTKGLAEGDVVVEKSGTFLRDGDLVRAVFPGEKISAADEPALPAGTAERDAAATRPAALEVKTHDVETMAVRPGDGATTDGGSGARR